MSLNKRLINTGGGGGGAFDVANFTPINYYSFSAAIGGDNYGGIWSTNGLHYYVSKSTTTKGVYQFDASTAWDVTSLSYSGNYSALTGTEFAANYQPLEISSDGVYFWSDRREWNGSSFTCGTFRWTLSTPYDISTAGSRINFYTSGNNNVIYSQKWYNDGSYYHVQYGTTHRVFSCPTPYSLTGATTLSNGTITQSASDVSMTPDGLFYCWVYSTSNNDNMTFYQFPLTTPFDLDTRTTTTNFTYSRLDLPSPPSTVRLAHGIQISPDGTKAYYLSSQGRVLVEFDTNAVF